MEMLCDIFIYLEHGVEELLTNTEAWFWFLIRVKAVFKSQGWDWIVFINML